VNTRKILDVLAGRITASCVLDGEKADSEIKNAI
jgi:hypothetical protein